MFRMRCLVPVLVLAFGLRCLAGNERLALGAFQGPINRCVADKEHMVIIVPTNESDKEAEKEIRTYAEDIRGAFFLPTTPIMPDREALKADLSENSLLVYGTPSGNLWLAKHLEMLPVRVESDRIVADATYQATDLRFITCWPSPYNPSKGIVIYTAQRAKDVVGINKVFHGPTDYAIAKGEDILRSGDYLKVDGRWRTMGDVPLEEALADLEFFFRTVESVHPQPLRLVSAEDYLKLKKRVREQVRKSADERGGIPRSRLALILAEAAAFYRDAHTNTLYAFSMLELDEEARNAKRLLPFRLECVCGDVLIAQTTQSLEHLKGCELIEIDGIGLLDFLKPVLDKISGERSEWKMVHFVSAQERLLAAIPLSTEQQVTVTTRDDGGNEKRTPVELLSFEEYKATLPRQQKLAQSDGYQFYNEDQTCYWPYNSFNFSRRDRERIDSLFAVLKEKKAKNLIIDLRRNGGGDSRAGDHILQYLTAKPYRQFSRVDMKVSKEALEAGRVPAEYQELAGLLISGDTELSQPEARDNRFEGRLFVLTGPGTFSSAVSFASAVKDYQIGTIIGEETGGVRESFGDILQFRLPNSRLQFGVSHKRFCAPVPKPGDWEHGTVPDVPLDRAILSKYSGSPDPALAFALAYVQNK